MLSGHTIWARVRLTREVDELVVPKLLVPKLLVLALLVLDALLPDPLLVLAPPLEPVDVVPVDVVLVPVELPPPERPLLAVCAQAGEVTARASSNASAKTGLMPGQRMRLGRRSGMA